MQRREFIALLGSVAAAWPVGAQTQQAGKQYRIGMLETTGEVVKPTDIGASRKGLRDLGYVERRNVIIEYRSADGRPGRPEVIDARSERYLPANALLDIVAVGLRCYDAIQREIAFGN
jgi:putative ABC transport system substrate-binding protein